jgi:alkylhydroperoxidase family enzyme
MQLVRDPEAASLDPADRAVVDLARKVALGADQVTEADVDRLRSVGLTEEEIFEVVLAAAIRCFFSKTLDATGTAPDDAYRALDPELRESLTVGRPIEE